MGNKAKGKSKSRRASCGGKYRYATWAHANNDMREMIRKRRDQGRGRMAVYRCRFCHGYHIGRSPLN